MANQDALIIGDTDEEGGDIVVYEDALGHVSFRVDADAADVTIGDPATQLGLLTIYGINANVLQLGDATHEGGDIVVYEDALGRVSFRVDADAADVTIGDPATELGLLSIYGRNATVLRLGDATHEGGDVLVYEDAAGNVSLSFDADTASMTVGNATTVLGNLTVNGNSEMVTAFSDDLASVQHSCYLAGWNFPFGTAAVGSGIWHRYDDTPYGGVADFIAGFYVDAVGNLNFVVGTFAGVTVSFYTDPASNTYFGGNLGPFNPVTQDVGASGLEWRYLYVKRIIIGTAIGDYIQPKNDNQVDLGSATKEFRNFYLDGWAYIDGLRIDATFDIDPIDIAATGLGALVAVLPCTYGGGATGYIPIYDGYT